MQGPFNVLQLLNFSLGFGDFLLCQGQHGGAGYIFAVVHRQQRTDFLQGKSEGLTFADEQYALNAVLVVLAIAVA